MADLPRPSSLDVSAPAVRGKSLEDDKTHSGRLYGYNRTFLNGRLIGGPDIWRCGCTSLMIFIPSVLWYAEVGVYFAEQYHIALVVLLAPILQLTPLVFLCLTAFCDPGIVPRQKAPTETFDEATKSFRTASPPKYMDMLVRGQPTRLKWCQTCHIYRPPRCTHCAVCDNCIEHFDHHCPWIGNCIGKRNYRSFFCFLVSTATLNVFIFATSIIHISGTCKDLLDANASLDAGAALWDALSQAVTTTLLFLYSVAVGWFTLGMVCYHVYLVATNQTTYEHIKGAHLSGGNPYSRGIKGNFQDALCTPIRPRYFDPQQNKLLWGRNAAGTEQQRQPQKGTPAAQIKPGSFPTLSLGRFLPQAAHDNNSSVKKKQTIELELTSIPAVPATDVEAGAPKVG